MYVYLNSQFIYHNSDYISQFWDYVNSEFIYNNSDYILQFWVYILNFIHAQF